MPWVPGPAQSLVPAVRGLSGCRSCFLRRFSIQPVQQRKIPNRYLGQPSSFTHPHLLKPGEVTPGLSQVEYALRRHKLMTLVKKKAQEWGGVDHTIILLSNPTYYMSNDIPYTFHQDTNFLYLCGFQEPDSILVLQSLPDKALPSHKAMLFVPRRDPSRELWDGPRSGTDGAVALTGVDEAYPIEEFRHLVTKLKAESNMVWYDSAKPVHTQLHSDYLLPLAEIKAGSKNRIRAIHHLVQQLRLIKSPAEIERMKIAGRVTSQAFIETMFASKSPVDEAFLYAKVSTLLGSGEVERAACCLFIQEVKNYLRATYRLWECYVIMQVEPSLSFTNFSGSFYMPMTFLNSCSPIKPTPLNYGSTTAEDVGVYIGPSTGFQPRTFYTKSRIRYPWS